MQFQELNNDQRRESINARQRFDALRSARAHLARFKGSMTWASDKGAEYLIRSGYETGLRRQKSLGPRTSETERLKAKFEADRDEARSRVADLEETLERQASINRALGLGRMPSIGARIARALDAAGLLGNGIRIVGTNAIYAYEATAGVTIDAELVSTQDIDLLFDARARLGLAATLPVSERSLMSVLKRVDRSFERDRNTFRAINRDGYLVDLIKPAPIPPWTKEPNTLANAPADDLMAAGIEGLEWLQNSPAFEAVAMDELGMPLRLVVPDPRAFAVHKLWVSERANREPVKRARDLAQAEAVAQMVAQYLKHLPYDDVTQQAIPRALIENARPLFTLQP